jgi:hypothetical protein
MSLNCCSQRLVVTLLLCESPVLQALADGAPRFHPDAAHEGFTALHAAAVEGKAREWLLYRHLGMRFLHNSV